MSDRVGAPRLGRTMDIFCGAFVPSVWEKVAVFGKALYA